jgi:hypothetical protein
MGRFAEAAKALDTQQEKILATREPPFQPRLPAAGALPSAPQLSVIGPSVFVSRVDGGLLTLKIEAAVRATWSDVSDGRTRWSVLSLSQAPVPVLAAPPGFDTAAFARAVLRAAGMRNGEMVQRLSGRSTTAAALLLGYVPRHFLGVREVNLRQGPASLIEEFGGGDPPSLERLTLLWTAADRVYLLAGVPKNGVSLFGADMAGAVTGMVGVANSIE